ncbi:MAG: two-component sensor histidine kinase [Porphyrobacter sp.]|nr:two-component sensor histidine kinase [Porphyrobacter sp.]
MRSFGSLTRLFLALFLTATVLGGIGLFAATQALVRRTVDQRITSFSYAIAPPGAAIDMRALAERIAELSSQRDTGDLGTALLLGQRQFAGNVRLLRPFPEGYSDIDVNDRISGLTHGRALVRDLGEGRRLVVLAETEPLDDFSSGRAGLYVIIFGTIILVVIGGLLLFRQMVGARIVAMRRTVDAIIAGDLSQRVTVTGTGDEFDVQAEGFNRMLARIEGLVNEIRHVTNDVSHELRSPLARLRNQLLAMQRHDAPRALQREVEDAISQVDGLLALFASILRLAEVENGSRRAAFTRIDLADPVAELVETMAPVASGSGHRLVLTRRDRAELLGDRQLLTQALLNLIENAIAHTPHGTCIAVSLTAADGEARLRVRDDGPGVPQELHAQVMRRFGRASEATDGRGHGIGLPLAEAIARLHDGRLELADAGPGLEVTLVFPLERDERRHRTATGSPSA